MLSGAGSAVTCYGNKTKEDERKVNAGGKGAHYAHNPYNGVICNDIIQATGVFSSKELWRLSKCKCGTGDAGMSGMVGHLPCIYIAFTSRLLQPRSCTNCPRPASSNNRITSLITSTTNSTSRTSTTTSTTSTR